MARFRKDEKGALLEADSKGSISVHAQGSSDMQRAKFHEGGCLCGHIRFRAKGPALQPHSCSCKICQRHSGALTTHWVEFPAADVEWTGPGGAPSRWRASAGSSRSFCGQCGSTLGAIDDKPVIALLLGVFDSNNREEFAPEYHSYIGGRPKWWRRMLADAPPGPVPPVS
jgi:hypothetical protein